MIRLKKINLVSNHYNMLSSNPFKQNGDVYVIAEIGKNFIQSENEVSLEEYISNSKELIDAAKESGADAVKFQTHEFEDEQLNIKIKSPHFKASDRYSWVVRNTKATPLQFWEEISDYCKTREITFFSTPMSRNAARKISDMVPFWKVGSGDIQDYLLLNELIRTKKPVIISTGMVSLNELDKVVDYLTNNDVELGILYCVSKYPCPSEDFNLSTIKFLKKKYPNTKIGFSDHSIGFEASLAAIKLGAQIIEKHFSMDRNLWGSDHKVSLTPKEMKEMVKAIKSNSFKEINTDLFYGYEEKELEGAKNIFRPYFGKKLVAASSLPKGTILSEDLLYAMRPSKEIEGISANNVSKVVGRTINKPINKYEAITSSLLKALI